MERMLAVAARDWDQADQENSYLLQGARLAQFEGWSRATDLALTQQERAFLPRSIAEQNRRQRRRQRIRYGAVASLAFITIVVAVLALWANSQRNRAEMAEQEALLQASIGLAALAESELQGPSPERGTLLALEALEQLSVHITSAKGAVPCCQ